MRGKSTFLSQGETCFAKSYLEPGRSRSRKIAALACEPPNLRHFLALGDYPADAPRAARQRSKNFPDHSGVTASVPDRLLPAVAFDAYLAERGCYPALDERFLPPPEFVWGGFKASDGAVLRWGHLPVPEAIGRPRAACVIAVGFGEFIEKHFETMRDLAARGIAVWCLDWRGQGRLDSAAALPDPAARPQFQPRRRGPRRVRRDQLTDCLPRLLVAHSMGGAIALVCLRRYPGLFAGAALSSPMVGLRTGKLPPTLIRVLTAPARAAGLGHCFIPGAREWRPDRVPTPETSRATTDAERFRLRHAWFSADPELRLDQAT